MTTCSRRWVHVHDYLSLWQGYLSTNLTFVNDILCGIIASMYPESIFVINYQPTLFATQCCRLTSEGSLGEMYNYTFRGQPEQLKRVPDQCSPNSGKPRPRAYSMKSEASKGKTRSRTMHVDEMRKDAIPRWQIWSFSTSPTINIRIHDIVVS